MAVYEYDSQNQELKRVAGGTLYADCPIGSEIEYAGTTAPTGFLECDGSTYSQIIYPELYAILGTTTLPSKTGYIIKAKQIGAPADFVDAIDNVIEEKFSYSTTEKNTGKKWIDGKDIYSRVISEEVSTYSDSGTGNRRVFNVVVTDANIDTIVGYYGNWVSLQGDMVGRQILLGMTLPNDNMITYWTSNLIKTGNKVEITVIVDRSNYPVTKVKINAVIEYTKTA